MHRLALALLLIASPAHADFPEAVTDHILPGYAAFAESTATLDRAAQASCDAEALRPAFHDAFDAWMGVAHLRLGPVEDQGRALAIAFWPDPKSLGDKAQRALLTGDPALLEPAAFAQQSVAARGLMGLERLLYPAEAPAADPCPLIRATAADLAAMAGAIRSEWQQGYADLLLTAGEPGNTAFLTRIEARQALFTQIATALEFLSDQRLGRPLGSFDKPRPERAEAHASGRSLRNVALQLTALRALTETLTPDVPLTLGAFDRAIGLAEGLDDPVFAGVAEPQGRLKVEVLQQAVQALREAVLNELGPELDVGLGFNAADGD